MSKQTVMLTNIRALCEKLLDEEFVYFNFVKSLQTTIFFSATAYLNKSVIFDKTYFT